MITVGMNYHVLPGMQQSFEEKFAGVIDALKAAPGHTSSTLWKDVSDDASYLITSEWSDEAAFQGLSAAMNSELSRIGVKSRFSLVAHSTKSTSTDVAEFSASLFIIKRLIDSVMVMPLR